MPVSNKPTVVVRDLEKTYFLTRGGSEVGFSKQRRHTTVEALKKVSFATFSGESIGVLGRNGSGKSTLLNLVAGNEKPTQGSILVSSRPTLLSVSAALQGNLSGLDNVRLGLLAKGLRPSQVAKIEHNIAEWSDIGTAIHRPLSTYSSGMKARLKFSIATAVRAEILLVDEALATGDAAFAERAKARMDAFLDDLGTVFIVSHSAATVRKHCSRAIWLHEGMIISDGMVDDVAEQYHKWTQLIAKGERAKAGEFIAEQKDNYDAPVILLDSEAATLWDRASTL